MDFNDSLKILNLDNNQIYDFKIIKKHYHFLALKYHPDKNKDVGSKAKFQEINKAYNYLYELYNKGDISNNLNKTTENNIINFDELLNDFLKLLNVTNNDEKDIIIKFFKNKYNYYNSIIISKLSDNNYFKELFKQFYNNKQSYSKLVIINTDIHNVLNDEIYKLEINNDILYIPLWYKEVIYEDYLIQIKINNSNEEFIRIDDNNNIYIEVHSKLHNLIDKNLLFTIGTKEYYIDNNLLYIKKINNYILNNCGIINPSCDVSELQNSDYHRSNIYVRLILD